MSGRRLRNVHDSKSRRAIFQSIVWLWERLPKVLLTLASAFILYVAVAAILDDTTIVEPFSVPKVLSDAGVTDRAAAQAVADRILAISKQAIDAPKKRSFAGESKFAEASSISIPSSGLNIGELASLVRSAIVDRDRVAG